MKRTVGRLCFKCRSIPDAARQAGIYFPLKIAAFFYLYPMRQMVMIFFATVFLFWLAFSLPAQTPAGDSGGEAHIEARYHRLVVFSISGAAISTIAILFILFYRREKARKRREELQQARQQLTESELRNKKLESDRLRTELELRQKDLTNFAIDLAQKRDWIAQLYEKLRAVRNSSEVEKEIRTLLIEIKGQLQVDEKMKLFQENIGEVNQEFYEKLHAQFPSLTNNEVELCGLIRMNLSNKEIAALRNVNPKSVKMSRYRLRKKLDMGPEEDIYAFLMQI